MEQKKRGIKPGTKLSAAHRKAISDGHKGLQSGAKNPNYKQDRTMIKVGVATFSVTADVREWLDMQPNKSQYILRLIREDMRKQNL